MNSKDGLLLWVLGTAGVFFIYSAYKNLSPNAVLHSYFTGTPATAKTTTGGYSSGGSFADTPKTAINGNGVNVTSAPDAYKNNPANRIPLRGMRVPF